MQIIAQLKQFRVSPRKVRLVSGLIRGMDVDQARYQLAILVKKSSGPMLKLLNSAVANAKNNFNLHESNLFVKDVSVDEGRKIKKFRPKGFGRVSPIEKKRSHIRITLEEKVPGLKISESVKQEHIAHYESITPEANTEIKIQKDKVIKTRKSDSDSVRARGFVSGIRATGKKFFRRKVV